MGLLIVHLSRQLLCHLLWRQISNALPLTTLSEYLLQRERERETERERERERGGGGRERERERERERGGGEGEISRWNFVICYGDTNLSLLVLNQSAMECSRLQIVPTKMNKIFIK